MAGIDELQEEEGRENHTSSIFEWDENSQLYYHCSTGFYFNPQEGWYYSSRDGLYYKFENGNYVLLSSDSNQAEQCKTSNIYERMDSDKFDVDNQCMPVDSHKNGEGLAERLNTVSDECGTDELQCVNNHPEGPPPPSEWLEDTLIDLYLSGYGNQAASSASDIAMDLLTNDIDALDTTADGENDAYELEEGEWIPDELVGSMDSSRNITDEGCIWWNVKLLRIEAPSLARFEMRGFTFKCVNDGSNDCKIEIFGGNLSEFKCSVDKFASFDFSNPSRIVNACLQCPCLEYLNPLSNGYDDLALRGGIGNRACMILMKLSPFMRFLELSTDLVKVLADTEPTCPLPIFDKLTHLIVYSARMSIQRDSTLINFLKMAPALESLTFSGHYSTKAADNYDQIELLPGNFLPFLKVIKLEYYEDPSYLVVNPLVKFFLRHARVLKELLIYSKHDGHKVIDQVKDQLLKCSRDSSHLSIPSV